MQTFYLIRHGQKQPLPGEPGLTELGHQQAATTAKFISQLPVNKIFSSPSRRTLQTAEYISLATKLPIQVDALLRERANWGDDPQQSFTQFLDMWGESTQNRNYIPLVGDSSTQAGQRLEQMVDLIRHDDSMHEQIVLVTHGGVIGDFLRNLFGDDKLGGFLKALRQHKSGDYEVCECSITEIVFRNNQPVLKKLASVEHLEIYIDQRRH